MIGSGAFDNQSEPRRKSGQMCPGMGLGHVVSLLPALAEQRERYAVAISSGVAEQRWFGPGRTVR